MNVADIREVSQTLKPICKVEFASETKLFNGLKGLAKQPNRSYPMFQKPIPIYLQPSIEREQSQWDQFSNDHIFKLGDIFIT